MADIDDLTYFEVVRTVSPVPGGVLSADVTFEAQVTRGLALQADVAADVVEVLVRPVHARIVDGVLMRDGTPGVDLLSAAEVAIEGGFSYLATFKNIRVDGVPLAMRDALKDLSFDALDGAGTFDLKDAAPVVVSTATPTARGPRGYRTHLIPVDPEDPETLYQWVDDNGDNVGAPIAIPSIIPDAVAESAATAAAETVTPDIVTTQIESRGEGVIPGDTPGTVRKTWGDAVSDEFPAAVGLWDGIADKPSMYSGGAADGVANDRAAIAAMDAAAVAAGVPLVFKKGTYRIPTNLTINSPAQFQPGAIIRPSNGVTVLFAGDVVNTPRRQIFDITLGGKCALTRTGISYPEYWGAVGLVDYDTDNTDSGLPIASMLEHAAAAAGGINAVIDREYGSGRSVELQSNSRVLGRGWIKCLVDQPADIRGTARGAQILLKKGAQQVVWQVNVDGNYTINNNCIGFGTVDETAPYSEYIWVDAIVKRARVSMDLVINPNKLTFGGGGKGFSLQFRIRHLYAKIIADDCDISATVEAVSSVSAERSTYDINLDLQSFNAHRTHLGLFGGPPPGVGTTVSASYEHSRSPGTKIKLQFQGGMDSDMTDHDGVYHPNWERAGVLSCVGASGVDVEMSGAVANRCTLVRGGMFASNVRITNALMTNLQNVWDPAVIPGTSSVTASPITMDNKLAAKVSAYTHSDVVVRTNRNGNTPAIRRTEIDISITSENGVGPITQTDGSTTLAAAVGISNPTISLTAALPIGQVKIDSELMTITGISGSGPYTATLLVPATAAHTNGTTVTSWTDGFGVSTAYRFRDMKSSPLREVANRSDVVARPDWSSPSAGAGARAPDIQVFTADGTWTKPTDAKTVQYFLVGAAGGGGSGARQPSGTAATGGGAGGAGALTQGTIPASALDATVAVGVGTGGAGGAAVTTDTTVGNAGSPGSKATTFGTYAQAGRGFGGGAGGAGTAGAAGVAGGGGTAGGNGGASSATGAAGSNGGSAAISGGGGGGGVTTAGVANAGGGGGSSGNSAGGAVGTAGGGAGGSGTPTTNYGTGGGGGGGGVSVAGGAGGNGTSPGGGGGGGGGALNGHNSGAGGAGGAGYVAVITNF